MKQLAVTFASATAGLLMLGNAALAQGFFERPSILRPPADVPGGYQQQPRAILPPPPEQRAILPPARDLAPPSAKQQMQAVAAECDKASRFCIPPPEEVSDPRNLPEGQITVMDDEKFLYLSIGNGKAIRYKVATAIAKEKMPRGDYILSSRRGGELIPQTQTYMYGMAKNPRWCPTPNIAKKRGFPPDYCMEGTDPGNPFGGVALYLAYMVNGQETQTLFRIHGTIDPKKIGDDVSSGCVRMYTPDAMDLYARVLDMRLRNIFIGIHVPQGPSREEYAANQRAITAQINRQYEMENDPYYAQRINGQKQPPQSFPNILQQILGPR